MKEWMYYNTALRFGTRWKSPWHNCRFALGHTASGTDYIGACMGPKIGLDAMENWKILCLLPGIKPRFSGCPTRSYTDCNVRKNLVKIGSHCLIIRARDKLIHLRAIECSSAKKLLRRTSCKVKDILLKIRILVSVLCWRLPVVLQKYIPKAVHW
jgi:hypothetical protein